ARHTGAFVLPEIEGSRDVAPGTVTADDLARQLADPAERADQLGRLDRKQDRLGVRAGGELADRLGVFLGDEVIDRLVARLGDRVGDDLRRPRLRLGRALACLGVAEGGFLFAFGRENRRLLLTLRTQDPAGPFALGLENLGALEPLGLHLP